MIPSSQTKIRTDIKPAGAKKFEPHRVRFLFPVAERFSIEAKAGLPLIEASFAKLKKTIISLPQRQSRPNELESNAPDEISCGRIFFVSICIAYKPVPVGVSTWHHYWLYKHPLPDSLDISGKYLHALNRDTCGGLDSSIRLIY